MKRKSDTGSVLAALGAALVVLAVIAGLVVLYAPTNHNLRLRFQESLASVADTGRLARCAWIVAGDAQVSETAAVEALKSRQDRTQKVGCGWYVSLGDLPASDVEWTRLGASSVKLCMNVVVSPRQDVRRGEVPDFTFQEINNGEIGEGHRCWTLDLAAAPRKSRWGSVLSDPP
jgi:hypothetical protein